MAIAPQLTVGFVLMPDFTMLAFAAFIDTLRLAADEGDRSRPIDCRWVVMTEDGSSARASNGVRVSPDSALCTDPAEFDYLVVVGGTLRQGQDLGAATRAYLARAAQARIPLVGICTGSFVLARAGLMTGRKCCVSWFHEAEMEAEFPDLDVVGDQLFVIDRDRITCAGGTSVIHLASFLVEQHVGKGRSEKGLRIMLEERLRAAASAQPLPLIDGLDQVADPRVRRAMLLIERHLMEVEPIAAIADALRITPRQLNRLFVRELGQSPSAFRQTLKLDRAYGLVLREKLSITEIAFRCGFSDASHFTRCFGKKFGTRPTDLRRKSSSSNSRLISRAKSANALPVAETAAPERAPRNRQQVSRNRQLLDSS